MNEADRNIFPVSLPFFPSFVAAVLPGEFDEEIVPRLDLRGLLIEHPAATFMVRAANNLMAQFGILKNDILVVDRSLEPKRGSLVVAFIDNKFVVRPFRSQFNSAEIWGVVTSCVRKLPGCPDITLL